MTDTSSRAVGIEVVCKGTPREMGFSQGSTLRDKILTAIWTCLQQGAFRSYQPWWMPNAAFVWLAEMKAGRLLRRPLSQEFPEMHDRLLGIAEGSGLGLKTLYLCNAVEPLMASVRDRSVVPALAACSAVAVRGKRSATGEPVIARNFDYLPFVQPYFTLRENRPDRGYRSVEFTVATMGGAVDGMNEAGLCIAYNYAYTVDEGPPAGTISMLITEALSRCSTVADAADWIRSRPRWGGGILMLADPSGDVASLELSSTRSQLRRPGPGEDLLFHTNEFHASEMKPVEVPREAVFTERAHPELRGRHVLESAQRRSARLELLLRGSRQLGADDLTRLLADHGPDGTAGVYTICVHGASRSTSASMQYYPKSRRIRVDFAAACQAKYVDIQL